MMRIWRPWWIWWFQRVIKKVIIAIISIEKYILSVVMQTQGSSALSTEVIWASIRVHLIASNSWYRAWVAHHSWPPVLALVSLLENKSWALGSNPRPLNHRSVTLYSSITGLGLSGDRWWTNSEYLCRIYNIALSGDLGRSSDPDIRIFFASGKIWSDIWKQHS